MTLEEPWMREVIARLLPRTEGAFLDVGVNLGQTLLCLRSVDRNRRYVGFEPNPSCVSAVQELIQINGFAHTTVIPAACAGKYGMQRLYHYQDSRFDSTASLVPQFRVTMKVWRESLVVTVPAVAALKDLEIGRLGLVKIDVEGFEADVLEALEPRLSADRPIILVEVLPVRADRSRQEAVNRISALLDRLGYRAYRIVKNPCNAFQAFTAPVPLATHTEVIDSDHLLVPEGFDPSGYSIKGSAV
jgi:FkbM family methyltransferase